MFLKVVVVAAEEETQEETQEEKEEVEKDMRMRRVRF